MGCLWTGMSFHGKRVIQKMPHQNHVVILNTSRVLKKQYYYIKYDAQLKVQRENGKKNT